MSGAEIIETVPEAHFYPKSARTVSAITNRKPLLGIYSTIQIGAEKNQKEYSGDLHAPMHGKACPSGNIPILPHPTYRHRD